MTDGTDGTDGGGPPPTGPPPNDDLRAIIREEIASALGGDSGKAKAGSGEPPESGTPKADEETMRSMVEDAMEPLRADIADAAGKLADATAALGKKAEPSAPAKPAKPAPEPTPESPQSTVKKLRKALWGSE